MAQILLERLEFGISFYLLKMSDLMWGLGSGLQGCAWLCVRSGDATLSATDTTVSPGGGYATSCVCQVLLPFVVTHSLHCNLFSPIPAASGSFASNSSQDRTKTLTVISFPYARKAFLSSLQMPLDLRCSHWAGKSIIPWPGWFYSLGIFALHSGWG